jgi:hypothetical protein
MLPGCSRAVFAATREFGHESWRGENLFLSRVQAGRREASRA